MQKRDYPFIEDTKETTTQLEIRHPIIDKSQIGNKTSYNRIQKHETNKKNTQAINQKKKKRKKNLFIECIDATVSYPIKIRRCRHLAQK